MLNIIPPIDDVQAYYSTDFREYAKDSKPAEWDTNNSNWKMANVTNALSGRALSVTSSTSGTNYWIWDRIPSVGSVDFDALVLIDPGATFSGSKLMGIANGDNNMYPNNWCGIIALSSTAVTLATGRLWTSFFSTVFEINASKIISGVASNQKFWVRYFKPQSGSRAGKLWVDGTPEPDAPQITYATRDDGSYAGIISFSSPVFDVQWFSMTLGGTQRPPGPSG
jgi:hypothetical protein